MQVYEEKNFKIIIADEKTDLRDKIASRLRLQGFTVEFATGGFHLLHILEERYWDYNLIILHEDMDDMPAEEMISLVRTKKTKPELPILFITNKGSKEQLHEIGIIGANEYILNSPNIQPIIDKAIKYFTIQKNS